MADERDAERGELLEADVGHQVHGRVARLQEVVHVPLHLDAGQPVLHTVVGRQVSRVGVKVIVGPAKQVGQYILLSFQ